MSFLRENYREMREIGNTLLSIIIVTLIFISPFVSWILGSKLTLKGICYFILGFGTLLGKFNKKFLHCF